MKYPGITVQYITKTIKRGKSGSMLSKIMILNILYTALLFQIAKYNSKLIAYKLLGKIPGLQVILQIISYAQ